MNLQNFFILCSGVDKSLLKRCPTETNKYVGIGGTVFFTAVLAAFAGGYALYTVFDSVLLAVFFALVWGFMIFNLDRYIVSSMKNRGTIGSDLMVALPRIALAGIIAIVISRPVELRLFQKEINAELITMEQEVMQEQEDQLRLRFTDQLAANETDNESMQAVLLQLANKRDQLNEQAIAEADGTGGSQIRNMGPIYKAKKAEADKAAAAYDAKAQEFAPLIAANRAENLQIETNMGDEIAALEREPYDGMAARMEALDRIAAKSKAVDQAHIFIMLLFMLIESAPVLVKLMSRRSPYDLLLHKHEHEFEMFHHEKTSLLKNATEGKVKYETEVGTHKVHARIREERAKIDHEVSKTIDEIKNSVGWTRS